jgi:hypothetical protein
MTPLPPVIRLDPPEDPLAAFKGILFGLALGGILWTLIGIALWRWLF